MHHIHELLPLGARPAIERALARPLSYTARYLVTPGPKPRALVILGEAHIKMGEAHQLGKDVVSKFELRGVETFQIKKVFGGRVLGFLVNAPRLLLRALSLGSVKGSTITDAKAIPTGHTVEIEDTGEIPLSLHVASVYMSGLFGAMYSAAILKLFGIAPAWLIGVNLGFQIHLCLLVPAYFLRHEKWAWIVNPLIAILHDRDKIMAKGTAKMFADHPDPEAAVVVMGRAHVNGFEREMIEKYGFQRAEL